MEITKNNFADEFDNIAYNLKRSCFVGFDAEFTAILSGEAFKHRLFSNCEERYNNLKTEVSKMIMTQVGLTMFQYDRDQDTYVATGYTFHLCPQAFADVDQSFIFQASTLNFLCRHKFDFNKFTYQGLPYLSKVEEEHVRQQLSSSSLLSNLVRSLEMNDERLLQNYCSMVSKWLIQGEEETLYLDVDNPILRYIVHNEVRMRFPNVLTTDSLGNSRKVLIYRDKTVEGASSAPKSILDENLLNHLLGFSRIISLLEDYKKPLVGHNVFLDVILLHNQFIGPLPDKYKVFKKNINAVFPEIYDTKYISHEMARKLSHDEVWKSNALQDLYEFFSEGKCKKLENGVNLIKIGTPFTNNQSYHEAGWDSYCSGYCFIRLGHWAACENRGVYRPVGPSEKLSALSPHRNRVNVIRGAVPYMSLVEDDPPRNRPDWLHVQALQESPINVVKVATLLSSYGSIDVKPFGRRTALVAASSLNTVEKILNQFSDSQEYKFSAYNVYRHSTIGRVTLWGGTVLAGSLLVFYVHRKFNT